MATRYDLVDYTFPAVTPADAAKTIFGGTPEAEVARQRMLKRMGITKPEPVSADEARSTMIDRKQCSHK